MFNLERRERGIIIFLVLTLFLGLAAILYIKSHTVAGVEIRHGSEPVKEPRKINLNDAGPEELMRLKGVGEVLANRISDYRRENGRFNSISDIKNVKGIGDKLFEGIKDDISIE